MAVIRINKTADYTVMSNAHFREKGMSLKAKGLLSLMLSLPDNWDYSIAGLVTLSKDGKDSVMTALQELEEFRFLKRTRTTDEKGQFAGYDYDVFEKPYAPIADEPDAEKPSADIPNEGNPYAENPNTENPPQLNTYPSSTKKASSKKVSNKSFTPPTLDEVKAYAASRKSSVNPVAFYDYYDAGEWKDAKGQPVKSWKQKFITWERYNTDNKNAGKTYGENGIAIKPTEIDEFEGIF